MKIEINWWEQNEKKNFLEWINKGKKTDKVWGKEEQEWGRDRGRDRGREGNKNWWEILIVRRKMESYTSKEYNRIIS